MEQKTIAGNLFSLLVLLAICLTSVLNPYFAFASDASPSPGDRDAPGSTNSGGPNTGVGADRGEAPSSSGGGDMNGGSDAGAAGYGGYSYSAAPLSVQELRRVLPRCQVNVLVNGVAENFVVAGQDIEVSVIDIGVPANLQESDFWYEPAKEWLTRELTDDVYLGAIEVRGPGGTETLAGKSRRDIERELGWNTVADLASVQSPEQNGLYEIRVMPKIQEQWNKKVKATVALNTDDLADPGDYTFSASDVYFEGFGGGPSLVITPTLISCDSNSITVLDPNSWMAQAYAAATNNNSDDEEDGDDMTNANPVSCTLTATHVNTNIPFFVTDTMSEDQRNKVFTESGSINFGWSHIGATNMVLAGGDGSTLNTLDVNSANGLVGYTNVREEPQTITATFSDEAGNEAICAMTLSYSSEPVNGDPGTGEDIQNLEDSIPSIIDGEIVTQSDGSQIIPLTPVVVVGGVRPNNVAIESHFPNTTCSDSTSSTPIIPADGITKTGPTDDPLANSLLVAGCSLIQFREVPPEGDYSITIASPDDGTKTFTFTVVYEADEV